MERGQRKDERADDDKRDGGYGNHDRRRGEDRRRNGRTVAIAGVKFGRLATGRVEYRHQNGARV